jgi:DMSO reductase family type II enzyme chaperone
MPTPSELQAERPRRSVFGNYQSPSGATPQEDTPGVASAPTSAESVDDVASLQGSIDIAVARMFLYRFFAKAFEDPEPEGWSWLTAGDVTSALSSAAATVGSNPPLSPINLLSDEVVRKFVSARYEDFAASHFACFGHTVRGDCPMNEIEYGDIKADPLFQPHRLSDLGAFFAAFGLELGADAAERIDHISIELEFMSVLAAKEAHALEYQSEDEGIAVLRDAQKKFLREHLGRWSPAFARRLTRMADGTALGALARLLGEFIKLECALLNVPPGSEDLLLRPVDDAAERLCDSCGIHTLPPGAATVGPKL